MVSKRLFNGVAGIVAAVSLYLLTNYLNQKVYTGEYRNESTFAIAKPDYWHGLPICGTDFFHYESEKNLEEQVTKWRCILGGTERYVDGGIDNGGKIDGEVDVVELWTLTFDFKKGLYHNKRVLTRKDDYTNNEELFKRAQEYFDNTKKRFAEDIKKLKS